MLSAFSVGALALSLLFAKEAKADQVTEGKPAPEDTTDQGTNTQAVSAVNKAEVDAAKDSLDQKNEQVKEEEAAVKEAEKSVETAKANAELAKLQTTSFITAGVAIFIKSWNRIPDFAKKYFIRNLTSELLNE